MATQVLSTAGDIFILPEREYDIVGGGVDETTKLQNCINDASSQGRIVILPPFAITVTTITIPANGVRIWGQFGVGITPRSEIKSTGINAPIISATAGLIRAFELKGVKVTGTGSGASQHGILFQNFGSAMFSIENCIFTECGGDGVRIESGGTYSYILRDIFSSDNKGYQFYIDANNSPCVTLENCYAGTVAQNKYGFFIARGVVEMINCNSLDGGTSPVNCLQVGDSMLGAALVTCRNCNFESFTGIGVFVDTASDIRLHNCTFVAPGAGTVQPVYMVQGLNRSYIDESTSFFSGGATYDNAGGLPIKIFSRTMSSPSGYDNQTNRGLTYWNSEDGRAEPLHCPGDRTATIIVTAASYTETRPYTGYIGVNRAGAVTINLFDPNSSEVAVGRTVTVKDESGAAGANNITVQTVNNRNLDGANTHVINTNYGSVTLVKRNNQYYKI